MNFLFRFVGLLRSRLVIVAILLPQFCFAQEAANLFAVKGKVQVIDKNNKSYNEVALIELKPQTPVDSSKYVASKYQISSKKKNFNPAYLSIRIGDSVEFPNQDPIKHNVFSLSQGNEFDLGTYATGHSKSWEFKNEGIVRVYCNVHKKMSSFILVSSSPWHTVSNENSEFVLNQVPAGDYEIYVWTIRGEYRSKVKIPEQADLNIVIDYKKDDVTEHTNKHGKAYPLEDDEIY